MGTFKRKVLDIFSRMDVTWLSIVLALVTLATPASSSEPRVVCYYTNWSVYRPGTARFNPQNINPYLCTHLIYAFGGFTKDNNLKPFDKYQDIEKGGYAKFTGLKTYNKNLKTLLAIGGWNEGSTRFSPMVASKDRRKEFVRNAIKFLRQNRFDGLDLDWEYPAFRDGGKPKDRENYARLVRELREEFEREAEKTGKSRLLLTMAVPAGIEYVQKGFDVKTLNKYLDWMNLLTYDYHSAFEPAVNHHSPLYPVEEPNEYSVDNELNIDYTIKFYLENGADRDKLVLGIPTYGRSYTLFNPDAVELGSPADGPGEQGDATREKGYLAYYEICESLKPKIKKRSTDDESEENADDDDGGDDDEPWTVVQPNPNAMGPFAYRGNQWVGYDDIDIVKKKAQYVAENGLGGIMFWSIDNDDFRGNCHGKPYPLIEASKEAYIAGLGSTDNVVVTDRPRLSSSSSGSSGSSSLSGSARRRNRLRTSTTTAKPSSAAKNQSNKRKNSLSVSSTTPAWSLVTPEPPTTPDPGSDFKCTDEGFFPHPRDCKKYFWCLDSGPSNLGIVAHQFTCPSGLFFNKAADSCDFARNVLCKKSAATTAAPTTAAPSTTTTVTTSTRKPIKQSTKNSLLFRTTTTTTTPEPEEEEYEDRIEESAGTVDSEDPKVIKELIDLIKKLGGVEQLEKQLHLSEGISNRKLYQKVLEKTRKSQVIGNSIVEGSSQNSRRGPQNAGLEPSSDKDKLLRKDRPQYTTINRARASPPLPEDESTEEEVVPAPGPSRARAVTTESRVGTTPRPLQYVNIRRARPSTSDTADDTASRNALFERSETYIPVSDASSPPPPRRDTIPEYVTIKRTRPTAEPATTVANEQSDSAEQEEESEISSEKSSPSGTGPKYTSIVRARPAPSEAPSSEVPATEPVTEEAPSNEVASKEAPSSEAPATVLDVQIATLINSPEPEAEVSSAEPSTTTSASSAPPASAAPPVRRVPGRRRSTTTPAPATISTSTQAAKDRRNNFLRRTKATAPPETVEPGTDSQDPIETTTSKYTRRANSRFKTRKSNGAKTPESTGTLEKKEEKFENRTRQPSSVGSAARSERPTRNFVRRRLGGANATTTSKPTTNTSSTPSSSQSPAVSRRPFRVASRRRPASSTTATSSPPTTAASTDALSEEVLQDISDNESIEDPSLQPRSSPKKTVKLQRRPLVTLKDEDKDQNPSATTEEESKRQSKKYSASFKQNQLDEVLKQKSKSQEETDTTTDGKTNPDDISAETAVAIAAHQLLSAPLPSTTDFDNEKPTKKTTQATNFKQTTAIYTEDFTASKTPYSEEYSSTPLYKTSAPFTSSTLDYDTPKSSFASPTFSKAYSSVRPSGYSTPTILTPGLSGVSQVGASSPRYLGTSNKYVSVPVEEYPFPTSGYPGLGQEPSYFTREYLLESPVTRTYDDEYQYLSPVTTPQSTTRKTHKKTVFRRISTTIRPTTAASLPISSTTPRPRRIPERKPFEKVPKVPAVPKKTYRPIENYDYYDDGDEKVVNQYDDGVKVVLHAKGTIECLDIGNFPHPSSCKKFISCARMESGALVGWEYICPKGLSFDPVGGICNWSAGLGCDEKDV